MDDLSLVSALRSGDVTGFAGVYDAYADRLFAYAVTLLKDRDAAADAVHDALLVARERIGQLRDPERLRPWLYAIVRNECLRLLRDRKRSASLDEAGDVIDETADAGAGARAAELRELVWSAAAALNPGEREVLELSVRHGLEGADLAAALGTGLNQAHALNSRARAQLEKSLGALLVARSERGRCAELDGLLAGWDGTLTPLLRKRLARHVDKCETCGETRRHRLNPVALLAGAPFLLAPAGLRDRVLGHARLVSNETAYDPGTTQADPSGPSGPSGTGRRMHGGVGPGLTAGAALSAALADRAGPWKPDGFPRALQRTDRRRGIWLPSAAAGLILALLLGVGLALRPGPDATPLADDGPIATDSGSLPPPTEAGAGQGTPGPTTTATTPSALPPTQNPTDPADTTNPTRGPTQGPTQGPTEGPTLTQGPTRTRTPPTPRPTTPRPTTTRPTPPPTTVPPARPTLVLTWTATRTDCKAGRWYAGVTATVRGSVATSVSLTYTTVRGQTATVGMTSSGRGVWTASLARLPVNENLPATAVASTPDGTASDSATLRSNCRVVG